MGLLRNIQLDLMQEGTDIGSILLKLRLLASRLGSDKLEEWIRYEMEQYPADASLPDYRELPVSYTGTFFHPLGGGIQDVPIPLALIKEYAGEKFLSYRERRGVVAVDHFVRRDSGKKGTSSFADADLSLLLQGKIYPKMECHSITGHVSMADLASLVFSVRSRVLDLTTEFEKSVPAAADIVMDQQATQLQEKDADKISITVNNRVYGQTTNVKNQNISTLINTLTEGGMPESEAREFAAILSKDQPTSKEKPFGEEGKRWWEKYRAKAGETGMAELTKRVTEAVVQYFGLG